MKIQVENESLVRDSETNAILETDLTKLQRHRAIKNARRAKERQLEEALDKINKLEELIGKLTNANNLQTD